MSVHTELKNKSDYLKIHTISFYLTLEAVSNTLQHTRVKFSVRISLPKILVLLPKLFGKNIFTPKIIVIGGFKRSLACTRNLKMKAII
jgi:hypothetical protein